MRKTVNRGPGHASLEVFGDIALKLHVPYTDTATAVQLQPGVDDYQERVETPGLQVQQFMVTLSTDETITLNFDLQGEKTHRVEFRGTTYEITLHGISKSSGTIPNTAHDFEVTKV